MASEVKPHPYTKIQDDYQVGVNETITDWLLEVIPKMAVIGDYKGFSDENKLSTDTPFDQFDSECHTVGSGIATISGKEDIDEEEELIFLINVSEHVQRPKDMLMFLGEYFKKCVQETKYIDQNNKQSNEQGRGMKKQGSFFITSDIMNYLGTACKMYIDKLRQELRISIALFRNPTFHESDSQRNTLEKNIQDLQILIIKRCIQVYKMIDYFHDTKKEVPLKYITSQPPPYVLNALFCKMKADYMRFIYECISGDNGLLKSQKADKFVKSFQEDIVEREKNEIRDDKPADEVDIVNSEIYYNIYPSEAEKIKVQSAKEKLDLFYREEMTLLKFLEHEIVFEYEKAMDQLFDDTRRPKKFDTKKEGILEETVAQFHPVFLSSLLNQTVFLGDVQQQLYREKQQANLEKVDNNNIADQEGPSDTQVYHRMKDNLQKLYDYVLQWIDEIDNYNYIMGMSNKEDQGTARSIQNLLERAMDNWKDPK